MVVNVLDLDYRRHADDLRETWQGRALKHATGQTASVLLSVLAHNWDDAMPVLLRAVFPGFESIATPFLCSAGKISKTGHVCADLVTKDGQVVKMCSLYPSERDLEKDFRELADNLKFSDEDRVQLFCAIRRWIVCDFRINPSFAPADPDAKRVMH